MGHSPEPRIAQLGCPLKSARYLEGQSCAQLYLPPRSGCFRDRAKLRRVDEAIRGSEAGMVQGVKELAAELKPHPRRDGEVASYSKIQALHSRPIDGIASCVAKRI